MTIINTVFKAAINKASELTVDAIKGNISLGPSALDKTQKKIDDIANDVIRIHAAYQAGVNAMEKFSGESSPNEEKYQFCSSIPRKTVIEKSSELKGLLKKVEVRLQSVSENVKNRIEGEKKGAKKIVQRKKKLYNAAADDFKRVVGSDVAFSQSVVNIYIVRTKEIDSLGALLGMKLGYCEKLLNDIIEDATRRKDDLIRFGQLCNKHKRSADL